MLEPHLFLLGVDPKSDPATMLGITPADAMDPVLIDRALRLRLSSVYQHPDHRKLTSREMESVLNSIRKAAVQLRASLRSRGTMRLARPWTLTEFDRNVMAVLVGYGGWNAQSRSRLVALAAAEGVTPLGLIKVIQGLGEYAKSGGPAVPISEIRPTRQVVAAGANGYSRSAGWTVSEAIIERLRPEIKGDSPANTIKLSLVFGLLTLLVGVIAFRFLLPTKIDQAELQQQAAVDPSPVSRPDLLDRPLFPTDVRPREALFQRRPTFLGESHPAAALAARDSIAEQIAELDQIARRLTVSHTSTAEIVFRSWNEAISQIGKSWPLLNAAASESAENAIVDVLFAAAEAPTVTDRLLGSLTPRSGRMIEPLDVWQGTWAISMLARISTHENLPPVVRERARAQLQVAMGRAFVDRVYEATDDEEFYVQRPTPADRAARAYLTYIRSQMVQHIEYEAATYDYWELWLMAQRRVNSGEAYNAALLDAGDDILRTSTNLSASGRAVNVLGRLVQLADFRRSPIVRQRLISWFDTEAVSSDSLWTVTSILAFDDVAPWFDERLVVPPDATMTVRSRIRHDLERRWAADAVTGAPTRIVQIDAELAEQWHKLLAVAHQQHPASFVDSAPLMTQLFKAARFNETAAVMYGGERRFVEREIRSLENMIVGGVGLGSSARHSSRVAGRDGEWAGQYEQLRRNTEEKLRLLHVLRSASGGDIGPLDAAVLVREALRGTPNEVRAAAQGVLLHQFRNGMNVTVELLDQLPDAGRSQLVSDLISEFTGRVLPTLDSGARSNVNEWAKEARLALISHALALMEDTGLDELSLKVAESYAAQVRALQGLQQEEPQPLRPAAAGEALWNAWNQSARTLAGVDLAAYERRSLANRHAVRLRLAEGTVQQFVAYQLSVLDIMAIVVGNEQPRMRQRINALLAESMRERSFMSNVLQQAVQVERTINTLWRIRLGLPDVPPEDEWEDEA